MTEFDPKQSSTDVARLANRMVISSRETPTTVGWVSGAPSRTACGIKGTADQRRGGIIAPVRVELPARQLSRRTQHQRHRPQRAQQPPHPPQPPQPRQARQARQPPQPPQPRQLRTTTAASCTLLPMLSLSKRWKVARLTSAISSSPRTKR
jgi:hypothetical protein